MPCLLGLLLQQSAKTLLLGTKSGQIDLLIGTHALLEDRVQFDSLGLAIIDEQHRFGVAQRAKLWAKSAQPPTYSCDDGHPDPADTCDDHVRRFRCFSYR